MCASLLVLCLFHRQKCPVHRADQRRRSARLIIRDLNASDTVDSSLNVVKSEGKPSHPSKSTCLHSDLTGSVWRELELPKEQETHQEGPSSSLDRSALRKERPRKRCGCSQSLEETAGKQPQNRKRRKFSDSQLLSGASSIGGQALEDTADCPNRWTRSKDKEYSGLELIDSHSPGSFQTGFAHSQEVKKQKEEPKESLHVTVDRRGKHKGKGHRRTLSEEECSLVRKPPGHKRKKSSNSKGKGRREKERLHLSQEQGSRQK